tara:strand:- start:1854 stop:2273 length:420 start_codon:yes stop_codon:yes gene_type:complete
LNKKLSNKDKKDWEKFVNSKETIQDKDLQSTKKDFSYIEKIIDLHGYSLEEANIKIEKFILLCFEKGVRKINIITGKGSRSKNLDDPYQSKDLSILKYSVPNYIKENKNLMNKILKIDFESVEMSSKGNFDIILKKKSG